MAEPSGSAAPPRRVRIGFLENPRARPAAEDDPLVVAANAEHSWTLTVTELGQAAPLGQWGLWHPFDLVSAETITLLSIERELAGLSSDAYMARVRAQIQTLVPDLPDDIIARLTARQILAIGTKAWQRPGETRVDAAVREADAANPPGGERASASSSRSPDISTDKATPS